MNVNSIHYHSALMTKGSVRDYAQERRKGKSEVCLENQENIASYSGSLMNKNQTAALSFKGSDKFFTQIGKSKWYNRLLDYCADHNIAASALISLVFASILRPITLVSLPERKNSKNDKKDRIYASCHSISSGLMGFVASVILTSPLDVGMKKIQKAAAEGNLAKYGCEGFAKLSPKVQDSLGVIVKNLPEWIIAVPRAALTIMLIPIILKYVFGIEKKAKPDAKTPANEEVKIKENTGKEIKFQGTGLISGRQGILASTVRGGLQS